MFDFFPPPKPALWLPSRPAIVRAISLKEAAQFKAMPLLATFAAASARGSKKEGAGVAPLDVTLTDATGSGSNLTSYTFTGRSVGAAAADRYIIVLWALQQQGGGNSDVPTITVGGAATTNLGSQASAIAGRVGINITNAAFASGTTADIVVNEGSNQHSCEIIVLRATGLSSISAFDTAVSTANPLSAVIDCQAGGVVILAAINEVDGNPFSFSGVTSITNVADGDSITLGGAKDIFATAQTNLAIGATPTSGSTIAMFAVALK